MDSKKVNPVTPSSRMSLDQYIAENPSLQQNKTKKDDEDDMEFKRMLDENVDLIKKGLKRIDF